MSLNDKPQDSTAVGAAHAAAEAVSVKSILFGTGPRFARDAFGPVLAFYLGWKFVGLAVGILLATALSLTSIWYEKRRERSNRLALIALAFVLFQAAVGLISQSTTVYLAQPVLISAGWGVAFIASTLVGKPLAGVFADEMYPFPPEVRESETFVKVFGRVSLAWGVYQLARSCIRLIALTSGSVESFLVVNFATGAPFMGGLMSWSIWYGVRGFRRSEEWGWAMRGEPRGDLTE